MRGVALSYETVREWCLKFGQTHANELRRRSPRPGDRWHLDEVFLKINGRLHYLWRAVDQDGDVLDILVQSHRDKRAARKFFRKLLKGLRCVPNVIITDKLRSYGAAKAEVLPGVEHCQDKYQNNRSNDLSEVIKQNSSQSLLLPRDKQFNFQVEFRQINFQGYRLSRMTRVRAGDPGHRPCHELFSNKLISG